MRRLTLSAVCAVLLITTLNVATASAGTHHHHHHKTAQQRRAEHRRHMHKLMIKRLHRSMPEGVTFRRFYDGRTHSIIHVATIRPGAHARLRPVPASTTLHQGRMARTSAMCKRVHCLIAVNGSFRDLPSRLPRGGEIVNGVPLRLKANEPNQAVFSQHHPVALGEMHTEISLHQSGVGTVQISSINRKPGPDGAALFTPRYGPRSPHGLTLRVDLNRAGRLRVGRSYQVSVHGLRPHSDRRLSSNRELTLVAHGQSAWQLRWFLRLADRFQPMTLTVASPAPAAQAMGTSFRLLENKHETIPNLNWHLVHWHEPRTLLATKPNGAIMLITIDGRWRHHSAGASMQRAADLARRLGASEAVNLDGGGSTTFVVRGHVLNHTSDGFERRVVNGLVVVRSHSPYEPN